MNTKKRFSKNTSIRCLLEERLQRLCRNYGKLASLCYAKTTRPLLRQTTSQRDNEWGKAGSLLTAHCPKYYNITTLHFEDYGLWLRRNCEITELWNYGKLASLCYARQLVNETTSRAVATCSLVVS